MSRNPKQLYIAALLLLLWHWPESLILSGSAENVLFSVITLQLCFVIACNILVREPWIIGVILIEAFCMMFNVTFFLMPSISGVMHEQIMLCALIIELLIITISLQGVAVGIYSPVASRRLRDIRRAALHRISMETVS